MNQKLKEKVQEALSSVAPITIIVLVLSLTMAPMPASSLLLFLIGAALLVVGVGFFSLGIEMALMPIGDGVGVQVSRMKKTALAFLLCMVIGAVVTVAEPDLQVLANQVPAVPDMVIILTVALGVGFFLALAYLRAKYHWALNKMLIILYTLVFVLAMLVPRDFLAVAFDSGGVTTGPITSPFIIAIGAGMAAMRKHNKSEEDSFGVVALCSVGPILAVMILGLCYNGVSGGYEPFAIPDMETTADIGYYFASGFPTYMKEVALALLPIIALLTLFQLAVLRLNKRQMIRIVVGMVYLYVGLVLFLTGVNVGFMPAGHYIGAQIAKLPYNWVLIPIGMVVGYFIVSAEPAVHVLNQQVEDLTGGAVSQKAMMLSLSIGMAVALALAMIRVLTGISILWFIVPGYVIALALSFKVPKVFTAVAFDSGGVASGPMTATFLLPFAMGACEALGRNVLTDAFGIVAMVAMTPLVAIQLLGLVYQRRTAREEHDTAQLAAQGADEIIFYDDWDDDDAETEGAG